MAIVLAGCGPTVEEPMPTSDPTLTVEPSDSPSPSPSARASVDPDGEGEETSAFDLEVGDCFSVEAHEVSSVAVVECADPHEYEVFGIIDHPAGPDETYPGDTGIVEYADIECQPLFESYVGHDYQTSIWYITSLTPSDQTWADGDREIICTLNQQDEHREPITVAGSAEDAAE